MVFRWRVDDGTTLSTGLVAAIFQEIRTCIAGKSYIFVIFQGGGVRTPCPPPPPLDPHMLSMLSSETISLARKYTIAPLQGMV